MSTSKLKISIFSNLPSGGAKNNMMSIIKFLKRQFIVTTISEPKYNIHSFVHYLYVALIISPINQFQSIIHQDIKILIVFQSWLVKSPYILRSKTRKILYICHEPPREFYEKNLIKMMTIKEKIVNICRIPLKVCDYYNARAKNIIFIANSNYSKKIIDRIYQVNSKVIYPGIDIEKYQKTEYLGNENSAVCIGAINKLKRQKFIISILGKINNRIRPKLILIGNGFDKYYLAEIRAYAKALDVKLKIMLDISDKDKIDILKKSKIFIYAPIGEPFGIAIIEAIASGIPIAAYKYGGGYSEVVSNKSGLIFSDLDANHWADKIETLLDNVRTINKISSFNKHISRKKYDEKNSHLSLLKIINS